MIAPLALALGAPMLGCDPAAEAELDIAEIVGGKVAPVDKWSYMVSVDRISVSDPFWCGGTHVAPGWILTAAHCVSGVAASDLQIVADRHDLTGTDGIVMGVQRIVQHPQFNSTTKNNDLALLQLDGFLPLPTVTLAGRFDMNGVEPGESATAIGWGDTSQGGSPSNKLREVDVEVIGVGAACEMATDYDTGEITNNQVCIGALAGGRDTCQGDSGGPVFIRRNGQWAQLGITSFGEGCAKRNLPGVYTLVPNYHQWIHTTTGRGRLRYTPGDFNADERTDLTITTENGSYWYFSNGNGTWNVPTIRTDLPFGAAEFTPGDFNGDGRTDHIITTASGSYWYFSSGNGSFTVPYTRTDLRLGTVNYVPGDFNGDGKTDLVITTIGASYWYFSNGNGTWSVPYTRGDLSLGEVDYTPGDFDGDGKTDLVITTASGSFWYFSNGDGTWRELHTRTDLSRGLVSYWPGDFDGDGRTDLAIADLGGSTWFLSNGDGTWREPHPRSDLRLGKVNYTPGDFDGDGKTDLVVTTMGGSFFYFSNGDGTWRELSARSDLPLGRVRYAPGDFDGDGKTDLVVSTIGGSYWYFSNGNGTWRQLYVRTDLPM